MQWASAPGNCPPQYISASRSGERYLLQLRLQRCGHGEHRRRAVVAHLVEHGRADRHRVQPRGQGPHGQLEHAVRRRLRRLWLARLPPAAATLPHLLSITMDLTSFLLCWQSVRRWCTRTPRGPGRRRRAASTRMPSASSAAAGTSAARSAPKPWRRRRAGSPIRAGTSASAWRRSTSRNFSRLGLDLTTAFDPCPTSPRCRRCCASATSARGSEGTSGQISLRRALSCYYSGNFSTGLRDGYVRRVVDAARFRSRPSALRRLPFHPTTKDPS